MSIRVEGLCKRYGQHVAVDAVHFEVRPGELVALLGPSGGGKSTILRLIAGLERPDAGAVWLGDRRVDHLDPSQRGVGFVFQHYALFRHMSVAENVGFGLKVRGLPPARVAQRAEELLALMGLAGLGDRMPSQLSGGQRQRVALARALAPEPGLLLLDEPFGAVDAKVREELRRWLRKLHDEVHTTSIFVTHDQEEAFAVSDRVLIIHAGRLEQIGSPLEILDAPATEFVARFVGDVNVLPGVVRGGVAVLGGLRVPAPGLSEGARVNAIVRAYDLALRPDAAGPGLLRRVTPCGDRMRLSVTLDDGGELTAQLPRRDAQLQGLAVGTRLAVELREARLYLTSKVMP